MINLNNNNFHNRWFIENNVALIANYV